MCLQLLRGETIPNFSSRKMIAEHWFCSREEKVIMFWKLIMCSFKQLKKNPFIFIIYFQMYCKFYSLFSKLQTTYNTIWKYINVTGKIKQNGDIFSLMKGFLLWTLLIFQWKILRKKRFIHKIPTQLFFNSHVHLPLHCTCTTTAASQISQGRTLF